MINEEVRDKLRSYCAGKLSHAYLICGAAGIGKRTLAQDMAKTALCESRSSTPCGTCRSCTSFDSGGHPDIERLFPSGAKNIIPISEIRRLKELCSVKPIAGDRRVVIINQAERMNVNAQNAFLKLLEEPEEGTVFLLLCSNPSLILPTVRSRCVSVSVPPSSREEIEKAVKRYENASSPVTAAAAAAYGDGVIGRALDLMAAGPDHPYFTVQRIMDALCSGDTVSLLQCMALIKDRPTLAATADGIGIFCSDALSLLSGGDNCRFPADKVRGSLTKLTKSKALNIIETAGRSIEEAESSASDIKFLAQRLLLSCREEIN